MGKFRTLRADEVECRVSQVDKWNGRRLQLLLYKDARCDMNVLDETVGPMNWQRQHGRDNANCIVSIWDDEKKDWISKEDTGTESNTEAAKGLASDSFKRACVNWGIGRELYTAPTIRVWQDTKSGPNFDWLERNGQVEFKPIAEFYVSTMTVEEGRITSLQIRNRRKDDKIVFDFDEKKKAPKQYQRKNWKKMVADELKKRGVDIKSPENWRPNLPASCSAIPLGKETTEEQWRFIYEAMTSKT